MKKEKSIDDLKMSGCLDTGDYDDEFTCIVSKQNTPMTSTTGIFERADFCHPSHTNLTQEILIEE